MVTFYCSVALRQRRQQGRLFCLLQACGRQWSRRVERRNVLTVDTLGSRVWVCVCLPLCPCVSVCPFSWQTELWEKVPLQTASIVCPPFIPWQFIPLISDGENRRCNKFNPMQHFRLAYMNHFWLASTWHGWAINETAQSHSGLAKFRDLCPIYDQSLLGANHCQCRYIVSYNRFWLLLIRGPKHSRLHLRARHKIC